MHRFPESFPIDDVRTVIQYIRNRDSVPTIEFAESAWWIVGYGTSKLVSRPVGTAATVGDVDVLSVLEGAIAMQGTDAGAIDALPWDRIIAFILDLIRQLFSL